MESSSLRIISWGPDYLPSLHPSWWRRSRFRPVVTHALLQSLTGILRMLGSSRAAAAKPPTRDSSTGHAMSTIRAVLVAFCMSALCDMAQATEPQEHYRGARWRSFHPTAADAQTFGWEQGYRESPRSPYWVSLMGRSFWAIHHYCWAKVSLHRAQAAGTTPQYRAYLHQSAIDDMNYVVKLANSDMVLLPEIYYYMGESYAFLKDFRAAADAYTRSRELKPDYWPPYAGHAKMLEGVGLRPAAKEILKEGLRLMPDERALQTPYLRLGGKVSDIVPAPRPAPPSTTPPSTASQAASTPASAAR